MLWSLVFSFVKSIIGPVFDYLNKRVDANMQMHIIDTTTMGTIAAGGIAAASKADELNSQIRMKEGNWGPMTIMMALILAPFIWHEWQVVLDSSRFIPLWDTWYGLPYPYIAVHLVGTWRVPALPDPWGTVELAIFQSFFIGASAAVASVAMIKAIKR
jgi:hypothetical protein